MGSAAARQASRTGKRRSMILTRRAILRGGLVATLWGRGRSRAEALVAASDGFLTLEAAPSRLALAPPPAESARTLSYAGMTPGPILRLKKGEELRLRLVNTLAEPTALSFSGLRTVNASAGYGGLTGPRISPGASADIRFVPPDAGFNLYLPHAGATDAGQQGRGLFGPIVVDEPDKVDVDQDLVVVLSDWSLDERGQIRDDFADPAVARGSRPERRPRLRQRSRRAARTEGPARRAPAPQARQCGDGPADQCRRRRGEAGHRRGRRPAGRPVRAAAQPVPDGAGRTIRAHVRHAAGAGRFGQVRPARRGCGRSAVRHGRRRGRPSRASEPRRRGSAPIRSCRPRSRSKPRSAPTSP